MRLRRPTSLHLYEKYAVFASVATAYGGQGADGGAVTREAPHREHEYAREP